MAKCRDRENQTHGHGEYAGDQCLRALSGADTVGRLVCGSREAASGHSALGSSEVSSFWGGPWERFCSTVSFAIRATDAEVFASVDFTCS
jgi:hypothetical protein